MHVFVNNNGGFFILLRNAETKKQHKKFASFLKNH